MADKKDMRSRQFMMLDNTLHLKSPQVIIRCVLCVKFASGDLKFADFLLERKNYLFCNISVSIICLYPEQRT